MVFKIILLNGAFLKSEQVFGHWAFERAINFIIRRPAMLVLINCSAGYHRASTASSLLHGYLQVACIVLEASFSFGDHGLGCFLVINMLRLLVVKWSQ